MWVFPGCGKLRVFQGQHFAGLFERMAYSTMGLKIVFEGVINVSLFAKYE